MKFLDFFSKNKESQTAVYVGIFLKEAEGIVFFIHADSLGKKVLAKERFKYSNGWENIVEDIDQTIYKLESHVKESPDQAIFFIYSHFVDKKKKEIKPEFLEKIKKIVKELELKPLGYIECHEALVEYLAKKEEAPPTALLMEFDKSTIDIFAYRAGRLVFEETVERTEDLIVDILPTFEKIRSQYVIPSRIILYNSSDLDIESSRLVTHKWKEDLFIQMPKVHAIHENTLEEALLETFLGQILSTKKINTDYIPASTDRADEKASVMGFVIGGDPEEISSEKTELQAQSIPSESTKPQIDVQIYFKRALNFLNSLTKKMSKISFSKSLLPFIGLAIVLSALFINEFFFHKAEVEIQFPSKKIEKKMVFNDLNIKVATASTSFTGSKETTGSREIGEKAKGTVTIYNSSLTESKNFSKGTILTSGSNLKFTLDSDVKVASASGDASAPTSGTAKTQITAREIGPESNLASGTKFNIEGQSASVIAKGDTALTGGSKKEIKTVSNIDIEKLKSDLIKKGKDYSKKELASKVAGQNRIIDNLTEISLKQPNFSKEVGEEASRVDLKSKVNINYFTYNEGDLKNKIIAALVDPSEKDLVITSDKLSYKITKAERKNNKTALTISAVAKLTTDVKKDKLSADLVGRDAQSLVETIKKDYKAVSMEFIIDNPLPFMKRWMPFFAKNISLKIIYQ